MSYLLLWQMKSMLFEAEGVSVLELAAVLDLLPVDVAENWLQSLPYLIRCLMTFLLLEASSFVPSEVDSERD